MNLVNIMNIGNELYSGLSSLSWQSYLLLTEVPEIMILFNIISFNIVQAILVLYMVLVKYKISIIVCHQLMLCSLCQEKIIIPFFKQSLVLQ